MFTKYSDLYHLSMSVCSDEEMAFKKLVKNRFGLDVIETLRGPYIESISVWFDLYSYRKEQKELFNIVLKNLVKNESLETENYFDSNIVNFANELINLYNSTFSKSLDNKKIKHIYVHDMHLSMREYAYGHAISDIRQKIGCKLKIESRYVLLWYGEGIKIIFENSLQLKNAMKQKEELLNICFDSIKKYDIRNILNIDDINLEFKLKSDIPKELLSGYMKSQ